MSRFVARAMATVTVVAATMVPAVAATAHPAPFAVTAGSAASGQTVGVTFASGTLIIKDTTTNNFTIQCTASSLKGSVTTGTSSGSFATISPTSAVFTACNGPAGLHFVITPVGTWQLQISDATAGSAAVATGNLRLHAAANGTTCQFDLGASSGSFTSSGTSTVTAGSLAGTYTNSTQNYAVPATNPGSLGLWNVHDAGNHPYCLSPSLFAQGNRISMSATWTVTAGTAAQNPVAIA